MDFRILGPLEASDGKGPIALGGARQRTVLAVLLLHENEVVSTDRLIDELWGENPPQTARTALQGYVSRLRRALGTGGASLVTRAPGYLLQVEPGQLDRDRFEALLGRAREERAQGNAEAAAELLREALALWRGPTLVDFRYEPFAQSEIARLEELRLVALEARIDLDLAGGKAGDLVSELEVLVAGHPLRERFRGQLMLALYRSGRQAEALAAYQDARRVLVEELGIEPGPELQRLEGQILRQEAALDPPAFPDAVRDGRAAETAVPAREMRKTVTVAAFALAHSAPGGGRLDPEALLRVRARSVEAIAAVLERHGGTAAGVTGETLVGVFGIPTLHEDDALRALRAAAEASELLPALTGELERDWRARLVLRTGVATGEVVDGEVAPGEALLAAEVVAGAMRLAEQAAPGETAIAESSRRLTADAIRVERLEGADSDDAPGWRLVELTPGAPAFARRFDTPLVGREHELAQLRQAFARSLRDRTPHLLTVLGPAGIGKSRLAGELPAVVGDEARVVTGRCLPYGEGITYWPLYEIVHEAAGDAPLETIFECLGGDEEAALVTELIAAVLGLADGRTASEEETFWAVCRLVEGFARERPLVVVLEDLHWAEPGLLDLVEHLAGSACAAPVLLVCLARPELLETRPHWGGGKPNATSLLLEPLLHDESEHLLDSLQGGDALPAPTRARITEAAEGNPLFLEQLLAMATEVGFESGEIPMPPTIEALLAARLDRLGPGERAVLDRAAVIGKEFWPEAVADLLPEEARAPVARHLEALVRKELIRPGRAGGEEVFRFRHVLIQQAACRGVPKELRAEVHERFADWLVQRAGDRVREVEEIVGYHLEQAFRYRDELGPVEEAQALAHAATARLGSAGRRARARGDGTAAVNLLGRATALLGPDDQARLDLLPAFAGALLDAGEFARAEAVLDEGLAAAGDSPLAAQLVLQRASLLLQLGARADDVLQLVRRALPLFEALRDDAALAKALQLVGEAEFTCGRAGPAVAAWERGLTHARRSGDRREEAELLVWLTMALAHGPTAASEALGRLDEILAGARGDPRVKASVSIARGFLVAMGGRFEEARALIAEGREILEKLGLKVKAAMAPSSHLGQVELLAGDSAAAVRAFRSGYEALERMGEKSFLSTVSAWLAEALLAEGRYEEAEEFTLASEAAASADDVVSQVGWRSVRARVLAQRGDVEQAEGLAREAVALGDATDGPEIQAGARVALAQVLGASGNADERAQLLDEACELYERKENTVLAERTRMAIPSPS
jgi:DNA-binding SARP family transcriptional activator